MARRVFFSFHYRRDIWRVFQVRNSWVAPPAGRPRGEAQPIFNDKADFEQVKRRAGGLERWIEEQLKGTSVTVVLFGAETSERPWVRYEIQRSLELRKGLLAIDIHNVKDDAGRIDIQGQNPFDRCFANMDGFVRPLSSVYRTYDWVLHNGRENIASWIETAARAAGY
jgi:hypothetical protein